MLLFSSMDSCCSLARWVKWLISLKDLSCIICIQNNTSRHSRNCLQQYVKFSFQLPRHTKRNVSSNGFIRLYQPSCRFQFKIFFHRTKCIVSLGKLKNRKFKETKKSRKKLILKYKHKHFSHLSAFNIHFQREPIGERTPFIGL